LDFGVDGEDAGNYLQYKNVPRVIGILISSKMATLHELETVYDIEGAYDMLEILSVDAFNINKERRK
jgi:hypothetical protein